MKLESQEFCAIYKLRIQLLKQNYILLCLRLLLPVALACLIVISPGLAKREVLAGNMQELTLPKCVVVDSEEGPYGYGAVHHELSAKCKTLAFFPDSDLTRAVARSMAINNDLQESDAIFFADEDAYLSSDLFNIIEYGVGIPFDDERLVILYYNYTKLDPDMYQLYAHDDFGVSTGGQFSSIPLRLQLEVQRALLDVEGIPSNLTVKQIPPGLDYNDNRLPKRFMTTVAVVFLTIIQLLATIEQLAYDKEKRVIGQLRLLGCIDSLYLTASLLYEMTVWMAGVVIFTVIVQAVPSYSYFRYIDLETTFLYLMLIGIATTALAFFIASVTRTVKTALFIGIVYVALHICSLIIFSILSTDHFYDHTFLPQFVSGLIQFVIPFVPELIIFNQIIRYIAVTVGVDRGTMGEIVVGNLWEFGQSISYTPMNQCLVMSSLDCSFETRPAILQMCMLLLQTVFYFVMAWGFYELLDDNYSLRRTLWRVFKERGQLRGIKTFAYASGNRKRCSAEDAENVLADNERGDELTREHIRDCLTAHNDGRNVMQTHALHKTFGESQAVKSVSLEVGRGECLALLGENGCGKTTTINMLIGALRPDKPDSNTLNEAYINGFDVRSEAQLVREQIGVCPEFSQLFDCLTPAEHIRLAESLRNADKRDIERNCEIILRAVELVERRDDQVKTFSGGMRRRVSIAMALVNNNQLVFLDEPTGSLDPECKRVIWSAVRYVEAAKRKFYNGAEPVIAERPGILLTTHDMVEAEALSGAIAIMERGEVLAYGNALQLIKKYGGASEIDIVCDDEEALLEKSAEFLLANARKATLDKTANNQYTLGLGDPETLRAGLFLLDELQERGIVHSYIMRQTTLERVFLNVAGGDIELQRLNNGEADVNWATAPREPFRHYRSVFKKLIYQDFESVATLLGYVILPIGLLILCLFVAELFVPWIISMVNVTVENLRAQSRPACMLCKAIYSNSDKEVCSGFDAYENMRLCTLVDRLNERQLQLPDFSVGGFSKIVPENEYNVPATVMVLGDQRIEGLDWRDTRNYSIFEDITIKPEYSAWVDGLYDSNEGKFPFNVIERETDGIYTVSPDIIIKHDPKSKVDELLAKIVLMQRAGGLSDEPISVSDAKTLEAVREMVFDKIPVAIVHNTTEGMEIYSFMPYDYPQQPYNGLGQRIRLDYEWVKQIDEKLGLNLSQYPFVRLDQTQSISNEAIPQVFDLSGPLSGRKTVGIFNDILARIYNYESGKRTVFTFKTRPHTFTVFIEQAQERAKVLISLFFMMLIFFSTMPILMYNIVLDKQSRVKTLYRSLAVRPHEYWLVNAGYAFCIATVAHLLIFVVSRFVFRLSIYGRLDATVVFVLLAASVFTQVSMALLLSLFFRQTSASTLFGYIIIVIVSLSVLVFGGFEQQVIRPWFYATPLMGFASAFLMIGSGGLDAAGVFSDGVESNPPLILLLSTFIESIIILILVPFADAVLGLRFYRKKAAHAFQAAFNGPAEPPLRLVRPAESRIEIAEIPARAQIPENSHGRALLNDTMEDSVLAERAQIVRGVPAECLVTSNIQKTYGRILAVRDVSLHFPPASVFGVLGASGAGKTTYLNIISGIEEESQGTVCLGGYGLHEQRKRLGVCLQDDVYIESLTVRQHLVIFALVKGFETAQIEPLAAALGIAQKLDARVAALSGGMRRRMNLAIALM